MKNREWHVKENGSGYDWTLIDKTGENDMGKKTLQEVLEHEDERDERMVLFAFMLLLAAINSTVTTLFPAYFVYKRILEAYPFIMRPELLAMMIPITCSTLIIGTAVFTVILMLYVSFHNGITGKLDTNWTEY